MPASEALGLEPVIISILAHHPARGVRPRTGNIQPDNSEDEETRRQPFPSNGVFRERFCDGHFGTHSGGISNCAPNPFAMPKPARRLSVKKLSKPEALVTLSEC